MKRQPANIAHSLLFQRHGKSHAPIALGRTRSSMSGRRSRRVSTLSLGSNPRRCSTWMKREFPGRFHDWHRRTFERRVRHWRATAGPARPIMFSQLHHAGGLAASDCTSINSLASKNPSKFAVQTLSSALEASLITRLPEGKDSWAALDVWDLKAIAPELTDSGKQ